MPVKDKGGRNKRRWERSSYHHAALTPVKERGKEGELGRKGLRLQSNSKKDLPRPVACP